MKFYKLKKKFIALMVGLIIFITIMGCVSTRSPTRDYVMSPIEAGYPTAEFLLKDQVFLGLGEMAVEQGHSLNEIQLYVQGYLSGTVQIDSERCGIHWSGSYQNNERIKVPLEGEAKESCIIDVGLFPEFYQPGDSHDMVSGGMRGSFLLKVSKPNEAPLTMASDKIVEMSDVFADIDVGDQPYLREIPGMFSGCGMTPYVQPYKVESSNVEISAAGILGHLKTVQTCVIEGAVKAEGVKRRLTWHLAVYKDAFFPLAVPSIVLKGKEAHVTADSEASLILVNDQVFWGQRAKFPVVKDRVYVVRAVSITGRVSLCVLRGGGIEWKCQQ